jgi:hypothetical protein
MSIRLFCGGQNGNGSNAGEEQPEFYKNGGWQGRVRVYDRFDETFHRHRGFSAGLRRVSEYRFCGQ